MSRVALIDGDPIVYITAFAAEQSVYETPDGEVHSTKGKAEKHCEIIGADKTEVNRVVEAEEKSHVLRLVKNIIKSTIEKTGASDVEIVLSGNAVPIFRDGIATIKKYKGTRQAYKPFHYKNVRDYMIKTWGASVVDGIEADDAIGIMQYKGNCKDVVCTIDKDLNMIEGLHYNYQTQAMFDISKMQALYRFHEQILTGDTVDNIPGIYRMGPVGAAKVLEGCLTEEDMFWAVLNAYEEAPEYRGNCYPAFVENAQLLWIMREVGDIWQPKW